MSHTCFDSIINYGLEFVFTANVYPATPQSAYPSTVAYLPNLSEPTSFQLRSHEKLPPKSPDMVRCVCVSDTHGLHRRLCLPTRGCDVLLHAGDIAALGSLFSDSDLVTKYKDFDSWLAMDVPCERKIVIAGNHDGYLEKIGRERVQQELFPHATYLECESITIAGLCFYGCPRSVSNGLFSINRAFQTYPYALPPSIPDRVDVFLSHQTFPNDALRQFLRSRGDVQIFVGGHLHGNYGAKKVEELQCTVVTACSMDIHNRLSNPPIVFDIQARGPL